MSFREKSAWITLVVLSIAFGTNIAPVFSLNPDATAYMFHALMRMVITFVAVVVIAHVVVAVLRPRDLTASSDERERLIELKSAARASYAYVILSLGSIFYALHIYNANVIGLSYLIVFSFVAAEIFNYALRVYYYRRGG